MLNLINGDCLKEMKGFNDNSFNLIVTSPPYNMNLRIRNGKYCSRQIIKEISTKYKNFDDNLSIEQYFEFNKKVLNECLRISELTFYNMQMLTGNKPAFFKLLGEFSENIKEFIIWDKVNAQPAIGQGVLNSQFEVLIVLQKSNPESRSFKDARFERGKLSNVWKIKRGRKKLKEHGATFPYELAEKIIKNFASKGDDVLDIFAGTGTTGEVCLDNGMNFTGIEIDKDYFNFMKNNLSKSQTAFA